MKLNEFQATDGAEAPQIQSKNLPAILRLMGGDNQKAQLVIQGMRKLQQGQGLPAGKFAEAINDFKKCLDINKKSNIALENIGKCYSNLGDNVKAIKYYNLALELDADNKRLIETIAEKLTEKNTTEDKNNKIVQINSAIKKIKYNYSSEVKIDTNEIKNLINKSENLINKNFNNLNFNQTQIFRKNNFDLNCDRHFLIFRNHKIIPEFCFSCIKVTINLDNVVDLIKPIFMLIKNILIFSQNHLNCQETIYRFR